MSAALATTLASNPEATKEITQTIDVVHKRTIKAGTIIIGGVVVSIAGYLAYRSYVIRKRQRFVEENSHVPIVQEALLLHKAMIGKLKERSFLSRLILGDNVPNGTDEKTVYDILVRTKNFKGLSEAYTNISGRNLSEDISDELTSSEYRKALGLVNLEKHFEAVQNQTYEQFTPYSKGDRIVVANPKGAKIYNYAIVNGVYKKLNELRNVGKGKEYIIQHVLNNADKTRVHYKVCDGWTVFGKCVNGDALINHTDIKKL